jgi:hypothetical protein
MMRLVREKVFSPAVLEMRGVPRDGSDSDTWEAPLFKPDGGLLMEVLINSD